MQRLPPLCSLVRSACQLSTGSIFTIDARLVTDYTLNRFSAPLTPDLLLHCLSLVQKQRATMTVGAACRVKASIYLLFVTWLIALFVTRGCDTFLSQVCRFAGFAGLFSFVPGSRKKGIHLLKPLPKLFYKVEGVYFFFFKGIETCNTCKPASTMSWVQPH